TLIKCKTDHSIKNKPVARIGTDTMIFTDMGRSSGKPKERIPERRDQRRRRGRSPFLRYRKICTI
ncbi:MAG: hypothetical protein ABIJ84_04790, partial [bacterium]